MGVDARIRSQANLAFRFVVDVDGERQAAFTMCSWTICAVKLMQK